MPTASRRKEPLVKRKSQAVVAPPIPKVDLTAPLAIEKETQAPYPPAVDVNAPVAEAVIASSSDESPLAKVNQSLIWWGFVGGLGLVVASLFIFLLAQKSPGPLPPPTAAPTVIVQSVTPTPTFVRTNITFEVLNGAGKAGIAARAATKLTALGYTVVSVGNAQRNDYSKSQLFLSSQAQLWQEQILTDLQKDFQVASLAGTLTNSTASARLIIGRQ